MGAPDTRGADRSTVAGGLAYVSHGIVTALAPSRLLLGCLSILLLTLAGWAFDRAYLASGGRSAPPPGVSRTTENPTADAERLARSSVARFVAGTTVAASVTAETPFAALRGLVDAAGRERLASAGDSERAREGHLVDWERTAAAIERARPRGPAEYLAEGSASAVRRLVAGVVGWSPTEVGGAFVDGVARTPFDTVLVAPIGGAAWLVLVAVLIAVVGGALARMSGLEAARGEKVTASAALAWLKESLLRCAFIPLAPLALVTGLSLVVLLFGVLLRIPGLDLIGGLLYIVVLLATTLAMVTGLAAILGLPMSIAAVACGDADALDATVRSTAYLFRAPFRTLGLAAAGLASIGFGMLIVGGLAAATLAAAAWGVGILGGTGAATAAGGPSLFDEGGRAIGEASARMLGTTDRPAGAFIDLWEAFFAMLVAGYFVSALIECSTRMYLVLRLVCDGEDPSSIDGISLGRPAATPPTNA